jgi:hypothetical protein
MRIASEPCPLLQFWAREQEQFWFPRPEWEEGARG